MHAADVHYHLDCWCVQSCWSGCNLFKHICWGDATLIDMHLLVEVNCNLRATGIKVQLQQICLLYMSQNLKTWGTATGLPVW